MDVCGKGGVVGQSNTFNTSKRACGPSAKKPVFQVSDLSDLAGKSGCIFAVLSQEYPPGRCCILLEPALPPFTRTRAERSGLRVYSRPTKARHPAPEVSAILRARARVRIERKLRSPRACARIAQKMILRHNSLRF